MQSFFDANHLPCLPLTHFVHHRRDPTEERISQDCVRQRMSSSCRQHEYFSRRGTHHALCHLVPGGLSSHTSTSPTSVVQDVTPCCRATQGRTSLGAGSKPEESSTTSITGTTSTTSITSEGSEDSEEEDDEEIRDCVIVGGGIAGLAAAADLEKAGCDFVLLEAGQCSTAVQCSTVHTRRSLSWKWVAIAWAQDGVHVSSGNSVLLV